MCKGLQPTSGGWRPTWRPEPGSVYCQSSVLFFIPPPRSMKAHPIFRVSGESLCLILPSTVKSTHIFPPWVMLQAPTWELLLPAKGSQRPLWTRAQSLPSQPSLSHTGQSGSAASRAWMGWLTGGRDPPLTRSQAAWGWKRGVLGLSGPDGFCHSNVSISTTLCQPSCHSEVVQHQLQGWPPESQPSAWAPAERRVTRSIAAYATPPSLAR